jgi:hypothetical protein
MEELVLFLMVACGLWMLAEVGGIMHRQYKGPKATCDKVIFDCMADPKSCGEWGPVGVGKQYPAAKQLGCSVCGIWTPSSTCSDCVTWAEVQLIDIEKVGLYSNTLGELKRRRIAAGW